MTTRNHKSLLVLSLLLGFNHVLAQDSPKQWTFSGLQSATARVKFSGALSPKEGNALDGIVASLNILRTRYTSKFDENADVADQIAINVSQEYSSSMAANLVALQNLPTDPGHRLATLVSIQRDLQLKVAFVPSSQGLTGTFASVIPVTVNTTNGNGQNLFGLWVRCNPQLYGVTAHPLFIFNSATTPTQTNLPPGSLICWIQDSNNKVLLSREIDLGSQGITPQTINLSIP